MCQAIICKIEPDRRLGKSRLCHCVREIPAVSLCQGNPGCITAVRKIPAVLTNSLFAFDLQHRNSFPTRFYQKLDMVGGGSSQNAEQNSETSQDDLDREPIPKKRKPRLASLFICLFTATGIIAYGFVEKSVFEYKPIKNVSTIFYIMEEKETYPVFFNLGLGLLGIIYLALLLIVFLLYLRNSFNLKFVTTEALERCVKLVLVESRGLQLWLFFWSVQ